MITRFPAVQAIVDKAPVVASAVLVSALHLLGNNAEIVKRWTNEIQEAVNSKSNMVQVRPCCISCLFWQRLTPNTLLVQESYTYICCSALNRDDVSSSTPMCCEVYQICTMPTMLVS